MSKTASPAPEPPVSGAAHGSAWPCMWLYDSEGATCCEPANWETNCLMEGGMLIKWRLCLKHRRRAEAMMPKTLRKIWWPIQDQPPQALFTKAFTTD